MGKGTGILCFAWSAAMLMYVPCVALCVNPPLLAGRMFLILAAWYVLWMLPYLFFPRKFCYRLAVAVLFAGSLLNLAHWLVLKSPLNLSSLFVLLNTNGSEAVEFVSLKASLRWLLLLPYLFLALQAFRRVPAVYFGKMGVSPFLKMVAYRRRQFHPPYLDDGCCGLHCCCLCRFFMVRRPGTDVWCVRLCLTLNGHYAPFQRK